MQKLTTDTPVKSHAFCQTLHVGAGFFTEVGDFVNECDLCRQERICCVFGQLCCDHIGKDQGNFAQAEGAVERLHDLTRAVALRTYDHAVRVHEIVNRRALAQEFRI